MEKEIKEINDLLIFHSINYIEEKYDNQLLTFFNNLHEGFEKIYKETFENEKNNTK